MNTHKLLSTFALIAILGTIFPTTTTAQASACTDQIAGKSRTQLEQELAACTKEILEWTDTLNKTKQDSASYARDVAALTAKINAAQASIKAKNIAISNLSKNISAKENKITELDTRITKGKKAIADILKKTNDIDSYSLTEAMLSNKNLSEFFVDIDSYTSTHKSLEILFNELRGIKTQTISEKTALDKEREAQANARAAIEAAKKEVEKSQAEKKTLLAQSQSKEVAYSQILADRQAKANQIRAALFPLRDAGAIQFGTALQYAEAASAKTGVRPALILGILQQESNLGQNVGTCVITNLSTGETKSVNSGKVFANGIHPTRDLPVLQTILAGLGRDPLSTKVSCPLSIGYGGAMGPAQFIPSTWKVMQTKVANALGKSTADPWSPQDAIMASALFLADLGASAGTYTAEINAACKYYSGRACSSSTAGSSYGSQVMAKASTIQTTMIDPLKF